MRYRVTTSCFVFLLVTMFLVQPGVSQAPSPASYSSQKNLLLGTWNLDPTKSKFLPGPAPRSQKRTYEAVANGIKATIRTVYSDGRTSYSETVADYDGSEHMVLGNPDADAIRLKKVNEYIAETSVQHAGAIVATARRVITEDGKSMTITYKGTRDGQEVNDVAVFNREQ